MQLFDTGVDQTGHYHHYMCQQSVQNDVPLQLTVCPVRIEQSICRLEPVKGIIT